MKNQAAQQTNKPVHTVRHGAISASIWEQDTEKGPTYNVTFQRAYKEGGGMEQLNQLRPE